MSSKKPTPKPNEEKRHPLYARWVTIKQRCNNENDKDYPKYGGRGISFHSKWMDNYEKFYEWCMKNGYEEGLQLDRKDNDGNYEPKNLRFVTAKDNTNNRGCTKTVVVKGETLAVTEAAEKYNITANAISKRLRRGLSDEEAVLSPLRNKPKK